MRQHFFGNRVESCTESRRLTGRCSRRAAEWDVSHSISTERRPRLSGIAFDRLSGARM